MSTTKTIRLRWWERLGVVHAHPLNIVSHTVLLPLLSYFMWQHNLLLALLLGYIPVVGGVLFTYLRWTDKPSLSLAEQWLYKRATRLNSALAFAAVVIFSYALWVHDVPMLVGVLLATLLLAIFGVTRNAVG
ncbi:MAG: hypothetical protein AB1649_15130 [Chloroflexota bacterium]